MLHDTGKGFDRLGRFDALSDEKRRDHVVYGQLGFRNQTAKDGRPARPAQAALGKAHSAQTRPEPGYEGQAVVEIIESRS